MLRTEDGLEFSNMEATGDLIRYSWDRVVEAKPVTQAHKDWKQTAHFSAEFCCQGRGLQRTREQESCSALRGRNNFRFPVGMVALAWDPKLTESLLAQRP